MFVAFGTSFSSEIKPIDHWFYFAYALCYFGYRMFDEMDGKQARRTGNSTSLGMLIDHGFDAFSIGFVMACTAKGLGFGDNIGCLLYITMSLTVFHFKMIEEYYVGGLFLGPGNAVTDMSLLLYGLFIYMGLYGNQGLHKKVLSQDYLWQGSPEASFIQILVSWCILTQIGIALLR